MYNNKYNYRYYTLNIWFEFYIMLTEITKKVKVIENKTKLRTHSINRLRIS